jgi:DNA polymerase-1
MVNLDKEMKKRNLKSRMLLQVHDELVFDAHRSEVEELKELVREKMTGAVEMRVPLVVDMNTGDNWLEAH